MIPVGYLRALQWSSRLGVGCGVSLAGGRGVSVSSGVSASGSWGLHPLGRHPTPLGRHLPGQTPRRQTPRSRTPHFPWQTSPWANTLLSRHPAGRHLLARHIPLGRPHGRHPPGPAQSMLGYTHTPPTPSPLEQNHRPA